MAKQYYYESGGKEFGPIGAVAMKALAANGQIRPEDLIREDGTTRQVPAKDVKGLFAPPSAALAPPAPSPVASSPAAAAPEVFTIPEPAVTPSNAGGGTQAWIAKARGLVQRGSESTNLDPATFLLLVGGLAALVLLLLADLGTWYSITVSQRMFGQDVTEGESYRGISYTEGKWVFVGALAAAAWVVVGVGQKNWLAGSFLYAGGFGAFAVVMLLARHHQLAADFDSKQKNLAAEIQATTGNIFGKFTVESVRATDSSFPTLSGGVGLSLDFAVLLAIAAAVAFVLAGLRRTQTFPFFQRPGLPWFVEKYGALASALALGLLLGIAFAVVCY